MSVSIFLTPGELAELTGRTSSAGQRKWLDAKKYRYVANANGRPIVARDYLLGQLGVAAAGPVDAAVAASRPNFAALKAA